MLKRRTAILIFDKDAQMRRFLDITLTAQGYDIFEAESAHAALQDLTSKPPDLVQMDIEIPDLSGIEVIRCIRAISAVPVIIITTSSRESDKIAALDAGANDYLIKPFSFSELGARIRALIRNALLKAGEDRVFEHNGLRVDFARRLVRIDGHDVHLTPIEFRILDILIRYYGRVITQRDFIDEIWPEGRQNSKHALRMGVYLLRRKLEPDPSNPRFLMTENGVGYRLQIDA